MFNKIKNTKKIYVYFSQFRDVRALGLVVFGILVLLVSWSGIKAIQTNYGLQKQIAQLQQENSVAQLENNNLTLQNTYYNTNQFLELAARQHFGLAAPGEKVLIVPQSVALAHTVSLPTPSKSVVTKAAASKPTYQRNFQAWMDFFLHRPSSEN